ncbi:putative Ig domain-containing protein [Micromonospora tulbaghiae]|uniref:Ig domain-containing protein n=2 Tax=Micromonospora tulbaghiae TaxID=479978 RepID=A0ABY0KK80_9ACTN|nr:putative Ig domain-containing protein [Micromonospora tulbaghiae]SCE82598.1 Putative Ig domain-containing protein [Micromonospora tulbaghiae]
MGTLRPVMALTLVAALLLGAAQPAAAQPATAATETVTITSGKPRSVMDIGQVYAIHTVEATGGSGPYRLSVASGALPPGMLVVGNSLGGAPTTPGTYTFTLRMTDQNDLFDEQTATIEAREPKVVITSGKPRSPMYLGRVYAIHTVEATGGSGPYRLSVASGALPPGMLVVGTSLGGAPTTPGTYTFTLRMTDKNDRFDEQNATVVVAAAATAFTSGEPSAATVGKPYSFRFTADGDSDIAFALAAGALPDGLTLDEKGRLSGTPGSAGTFTFTVAAKGYSTSATKQVSLTVAAPAPSTPTATPADPTATPTPADPTATPTPSDPAGTPSESSTAAPQPTPSPSKVSGAWLPITGPGSPLVLLLLSVVAFSVGGILLVLAYNRRRSFTTPE